MFGVSTVEAQINANLTTERLLATLSVFFGGLAALLVAWFLCGTEQSPAQLVVQIGQNFNGSTFLTDSQGLPPDSNGAIGPRHFMEFINGAVAVYKKTNGVNIQRKSDLKFWSDAGLIISPDSTTSRLRPAPS